MVLDASVPKNIIEIMGFKVKTVNTKILQKLKAMGIFIENISTNQFVKDPDFYKQVTTGLAYGFSNMKKEYNISMPYEAIEFISDLEREPVSDSLLDTTLRKELEKVLETCKSKNWRITIHFVRPIYGIHSILVNQNIIGMGFEIIFNSTGSMENSQRGISPLTLGDKENKHYLVCV